MSSRAPPPMKNSSRPPKFSRILAKEDGRRARAAALQRRSAVPAVPAVAVVRVGRCKRPREEGRRPLPFSRTPFSMFLRKFFASAGTLSRNIGRVSLMLTGMFFIVSIGVLPAWTDASARRCASTCRCRGVAEAWSQGRMSSTQSGSEIDREGLLDVGGVVPVGEDDALGVGGGARGVADVRGVALGHQPPRRVERRPAGPRHASPRANTASAGSSSGPSAERSQRRRSRRERWSPASPADRS